MIQNPIELAAIAEVATRIINGELEYDEKMAKDMEPMLVDNIDWVTDKGLKYYLRWSEEIEHFEVAGVLHKEILHRKELKKTQREAWKLQNKNGIY